MRYLHVELPSLHLVWERPEKDPMMCSVIRTNYPKPSPLIVCAIAREAGLDVNAVDMKIRDQDQIIPYRHFAYGDGVMHASRMGMAFESVADRIAEADILGISVNPTSWANITLDFLRFARFINPKLKVIVGGTDAMFRDEFYVKTGLVDFVIRGEGEYAGHALLKKLATGKTDFLTVPRISFYQNGQIFKTPKGPTVHLDDIPLPALDLFTDDIPLWTTPIEYWSFPEGVQPPIGFIELSRGCNESCGYCTTPAKYGRFRVQSLDRVKGELDHFRRFGITTLNIWDDSMSSLVMQGETERLLATIRLIRAEGFSFEFSQGMVISHLWDVARDQPNEALIRELYGHEMVNGKWIGCYAEYFPLECLQQENPHNAYDKLMTFDRELCVLDAILDAGIPRLTYSTIVGANEDDESGIRLATERLKEVTARIETRGAQGFETPFMFQAFRGTSLYPKYASQMTYPIDDYPELYQLNAAGHHTSHFTAPQLTARKKEMERELYGEECFKRWINTGRYPWK